MKRIGLYLGFPPEGGGAFQYAQSTLAAMAALPPGDYEVVVAHAHPAWPAYLSTFGNRLRVIEVRPRIADHVGRLALRLGLPLAVWHAISRRLRGSESALLAEGCDLWCFPAQDYLAYALPAPTVGTIHDLMHRHESRFPEVSAWGLYRRRERHYRNMCRHAQAILVDSFVGKRHVLDAYPIAEGRVHVLPYAPPGYIHAKTAPVDFDEQFDLPEQFVFYPAQLWKHKNHERLLAALALARRQHPQLNLVLVGSDKGAGESIRAKARQLDLSDAVHLLGYVPDAYMAELYRRSIGLVMPTFFGPTNIPPLEAMAVGCPMAVSDIYAMREQSGDAAIYFDPMSVDGIAHAINELVSNIDLRNRLIAAGADRIANLNQAAFNSEFHHILRSILHPA
jgi:glycosyltransferase involved in cell wall biosynthesis